MELSDVIKLDNHNKEFTISARITQEQRNFMRKYKISATALVRAALKELMVGEKK
jgi:putative alpha-1,2-mannosidase